MNLAKKRRAPVASGSNGICLKPSSSTKGCTQNVKPWSKALRLAWEIHLYKGRQTDDFKTMPASFEAGWNACVEYIRDFSHNL